MTRALLSQADQAAIAAGTFTKRVPIAGMGGWRGINLTPALILITDEQGGTIGVLPAWSAASGAISETATRSAQFIMGSTGLAQSLAFTQANWQLYVDFSGEAQADSLTQLSVALSTSATSLQYLDESQTLHAVGGSFPLPVQTTRRYMTPLRTGPSDFATDAGLVVPLLAVGPVDATFLLQACVQNIRYRWGSLAAAPTAGGTGSLLVKDAAPLSVDVRAGQVAVTLKVITDAGAGGILQLTELDWL